jgi:hypothetical protein
MNPEIALIWSGTLVVMGAICFMLGYHIGKYTKEAGK